MKKDTDKTKEQLLAELAELRKKSKEQEDKLKAANQQLEAHNQQLQASEQQLRAINRQLRATEQQLRAANQQLEANNQQLIASEEEIKEHAHKLGERVKELNCLHSISESVRTRETMEEILQDVTEVIPPSWQYPQITCSKITLWDKEYKTENYEDTQWKLGSDIRVNKKIAGKIEVCYLEKKPESDIGPFLNEERILLDDIAERLGRIIERKNAEEALKATNQQLRAANQQLEAQNHQLRGTEQQLRAANQELKKAIEEVNKRNSELSFLYNLSLSINKSLSVDDVIKQSLEYLNSMMKPFMSFFFIKNKEELNLKQACPSKTIKVFEGVETHKVGECMCGLSVSQNKALYSKNIFEDMRCTRDECKEAGLKSFAALPLRHEGNVIGVIGISSLEERDFEKESKFLETISEQISTAFSKSKLLQTLKDNEARLKEAELISKMGHFTWDIKSADVTWSNGLHILLGYDKSEKINYNKVNAEIHHPDDLERITAWLNECIASGKSSFPPNEYRLLRKDGKVLHVQTTVKVLFQDDLPYNMIGTVQDITERKQAEEEILLLNKELEQRVKDRTTKLEASNKELEAFAFSVSHDLRAPLRAINGFTRILMEDYVEKLDDEGKRLGSIIQSNARKMGKLIDDLLAFSRLGRTSMQFSGIDMKNMANAIYHEATSSSERKRIKFSVADLPDAYGDTNMLRQVWINLISNAIKFSSKREKAVISITSIQDDETTAYRISDNGAGFDMQYIDKIFGVFQRLHSDKEFPGTGVGLSLVQRIIHRHGGEIWAESEIDKGATFYFSLPTKGINETNKL